MPLRKNSLALASKLFDSCSSRFGAALPGAQQSFASSFNATPGNHAHGAIFGLNDDQSKDAQSAPKFSDNFLKTAQMCSRQPLGLGSALQRRPFSLGSPMTFTSHTQPRVPDEYTGNSVRSLVSALCRFWQGEQAPNVMPISKTRGLNYIGDQTSTTGYLTPLCTALFLGIISCNLLGLMPLQIAPTSGLGFATGLGVSVWAAATLRGFTTLGFKFPGHFIPGGTSWVMAPLFVVLEPVSYSFRAVSLGVRLWVNMLAGHTLLHILTGMSMGLAFALPFYLNVPVMLIVCTLLSALVGMEFLVAILQSGVFALLTSIYHSEFPPHAAKHVIDGDKH